VNHGSEISIGFLASQSDSLELLEFNEEIFNEMAPFVDFFIDLQWRFGRCEMTICAPRLPISSMIQFESNALSARIASNSMSSIKGATPIVS
jgi:hypothetical protein